MARRAHTPGSTKGPHPQHLAPRYTSRAIAPTAGTADTSSADIAPVMGDPLGVVSSPARPKSPRAGRYRRAISSFPVS
jgi:hypothetical protein